MRPVDDQPFQLGVHRAQPTAIILRLENINKSFGSVHVLRGVSLELVRGEVHAIVGENGAGKSTMMHILTGSQHPDNGTIVFDGQPRNEWDNEMEAIEAGMSIVYQ